MAQITINIPDNVQARVVNAICEAKGYNDGLKITKSQFAKRVIVGYIKDLVKQVESNQAVLSAREEASDKVENEIDLT